MEMRQYTFATADGTVILSHEREQFAPLTTVGEMLPALLTECADSLTALGYSTEPDAWIAQKGAGIPRNGGVIRLRKATGTATGTAKATGTKATATVTPATFEARVEARARELAFTNDIRPSEARQAALAELGAVAIQAHEHLVARWQTKVGELTAQLSSAQSELTAAQAALTNLRKRLAPATPKAKATRKAKAKATPATPETDGATDGATA